MYKRARRQFNSWALGLCSLVVFFFFLPNTVQAVLCSECSEALQEDNAFCRTRYDICIEDPGNCNILDEDSVYNTCLAQEAAACQAALESCTNDIAIDNFNICTRTCEEPTANAAPTEEVGGEARPETSSEPRQIQSPRFDVLLNQGLLRANISKTCTETGKCQITDMLQILINVMTFIIGITGSIFLLMFVWGGFTWLTSAGQAAKFQQGLDTIRDAIIGLVIVFSAYIIVNSALSLVTRGTLPTGDLDSTLDNATSVDTIQVNTN